MSEIAEATIQQDTMMTEDSLTQAAGPSGWLYRVVPWLTGSGMALGQSMLATACSVPRVGKCVGCGSCVVAVATLSGWALQRRKAERALREQHGLEPFEVNTAMPDAPIASVWKSARKK